MNFLDEIWALIPARGGSKSIPFKNMALLNGRPLIEYAIRAGKASRSISRMFCSTDHDKIASFCSENGVEVQQRPPELAGDSVSTLDVIVYFLETFIREKGSVGGIVTLMEPTSPFVLPMVIDKCVKLLKDNPGADSVQTITTIPPNHHAYNQRYIKDGYVFFRFSRERENKFNKQLKPEFYVHGNLRVFRSKSVLEKRDIYGDSMHYIIPRAYAMDIDGPEDLKLAECMIRCGLVELP